MQCWRWLLGSAVPWSYGTMGPCVTEHESQISMVTGTQMSWSGRWRLYESFTLLTQYNYSTHMYPHDRNVTVNPHVGPTLAKTPHRTTQKRHIERPMIPDAYTYGDLTPRNPVWRNGTHDAASHYIKGKENLNAVHFLLLIIYWEGKK